MYVTIFECRLLLLNILLNPFNLGVILILIGTSILDLGDSITHAILICLNAIDIIHTRCPKFIEQSLESADGSLCRATHS